MEARTPNNMPAARSAGLPLAVALKFLDGHRELALATVDGGSPRLRAFQVMGVEARGDAVDLFFATAPFKAVYAQLRAQPYVEMLAMAGTVSVRMGGEASFDVSDGVCRALFSAPGNEVLPRLYAAYDTLAYFRVRLRFIDYFDDGPAPCVYEHFALNGQ